MKINRLSVAAASLACGSLVTGQAFAVSARQLDDLIGVRGSSGENVLGSRGFEFAMGGSATNDSRDAFWWHKNDKNCIRVTTRDGRFAAIVDAKDQDCGKKSGNGSGAAVAIAAIGAIALAAALASKSHKNDDDRPANFEDLRGWDSWRAADEMGRRGFNKVDGWSEGRRTYSVYFRPYSRQCVNVTDKRGRVKDIGYTDNRNCR